MGSFWIDNAPTNTGVTGGTLGSVQPAPTGNYTSPGALYGGGASDPRNGGYVPDPYGATTPPDWASQIPAAPPKTPVYPGTTPLPGGPYAPPDWASTDPRLTTQPQPYQQGPGGLIAPGVGTNAGGGFTLPRDNVTIGDINAGTQGQSQGGQGDPKQIALHYAQSLGPPSPENIQKTADYMRSQGYNVQANPGSDGFFINGVGVDMVSNFKGGGQQNWQWLPDSPMGGGGNPNDPSGFQTGTFTGGGQYPLASVMGTGLAQPWTTPFKAPDNLTEQNDPGFQARMKMGTDAIQRSAASKGTLLTGGLLKGLDRYAQDYASNEYGNVYSRALGEYQQAYGIFNNNQGNLFNRLSSLGSVGENAAAGVGNAQIGAGDARAQGSIAQGNIWGNTINNGVNAGLQYLNQKYGQQNQGQTFPNDPVFGQGGVNIIAPDKG